MIREKDCKNCNFSITQEDRKSRQWARTGVCWKQGFVQITADVCPHFKSKNEERNGMQIFKIRHKDTCKRCGNTLTVKGIAESRDKYYKVISYCDICGAIIEFERLDRRLVK